MTNEEFGAVVEERVAKMRATLVRKGAEYARGDRLSNFKHGGSLLRCTPVRACLGYWAKHVASIVDLVLDTEAGSVVPEELWDEKIGDAVNYLVLLEALLREPCSTPRTS